MPIRPQIRTLTNASVDILNAIRNSASVNYRDYVPLATADAESIREIGSVIMDMPALQNEFISTLVNRIARVVITSKQYDNPWAFFKKGYLEFGEVVEDVFVALAKPFTYDPEVAETNVFKREIPNVRTTFYIMNYKKFYKVTIQNESLRQAFLSYEGITELIAKITESLYTSANYDEFQVMKYMLARRILNGEMHATEVANPTAANAKTIASTFRATSNKFEFLNSTYNLAGVPNHATKDRQYLIINSDFDAIFDVEVLASAFNMTKAEFLGHRVLVDGFGDLDNDRLAEIFADDDTYTPVTDDEMTALNAIPAILVDGDFFMIFDNMNEFTENYNGQGLYWNYFYHQWKTFAISPFANNTVFVPSTPAITSVTVTPDEATVGAGTSIQLTSTVATTGFAPQTVDWTSSVTGVTVTATGLVTIPADVTAESVTITATSTYDDSVSDTCTLTIASASSDNTPG